MRRSSRSAIVTVVVLAALAVLAATTGCGLETEKANQVLSQATKHQEEAEVLMQRIKVFPNDWEVNFNVPRVTPQQIANVRTLIASREKDLDDLETALSEWEKDMRRIKRLNVDDMIKEYSKLKTSSISSFSQYVTEYLRPILKAYSGLLEMIAMGRPAADLNKAAQEISGLVSESVAKLEECEGAEKLADNYFKKNNLGKYK